MADDRIKVLEERLTRLEGLLSQRPAQGAGTTPPGGIVVDPAPWGGGWVPRPRYPSPVVDPAPWYGGGWGYPRWPTPVVDPAPWPTPIVDPAPWGNVFQQPTVSATALGRIGAVGDPPPFDFSRLSVSQLESTLHSINAEKARLDSMETMVKQQLERAKKQG
jgi:hypothetical protein